MVPAVQLHRAPCSYFSHPKERPLIASMTLRLNSLSADLREYFKTGIGEFYISPAHRWLVYAITFILVGLFTFMSLDVYESTDPLLTIPLTFKGMYAWHTAINFTVCLALVDILAAWLFRGWGTFGKRTVGKLWIVFLIAYSVGFICQRTLVYQLVVFYSPEILWVHEMNPSQRPGVVPMFLFMLPFWVLIQYGVMRIILYQQRQVQELLRVRIDTILEERQAAGTFCEENKKRPPDQTMRSGRLPLDNNHTALEIKDISHVTAEDHYLRIFYQCTDGIAKSTLIRMPLKELVARLPANHFIQIHRSHMVNLQQIAGLKRSGRNYRVTTRSGNVELPVSRYRLPKILPVLDQFLHPQ